MGEELDRATFSGGEESQSFRLLRSHGFEIEPKEAIPALLAKFRAQAEAGTELGVQGYLRRYRGLDVRVSFGQGNFSRVPWIAFLATGQQVSMGIYPVLLLFREQNVLLLCYGLSEENQAGRSWGDLHGAQTVDSWFRARFNRGATRYGTSYLRAVYELTQELPTKDLNRELDLLIDQYKAIMNGDTSEPLPTPLPEPIQNTK